MVKLEHDKHDACTLLVNQGNYCRRSCRKQICREENHHGKVFILGSRTHSLLKQILPEGESPPAAHQGKNCVLDGSHLVRTAFGARVHPVKLLQLPDGLDQLVLCHHVLAALRERQRQAVQHAHLPKGPAFVFFRYRRLILRFATRLVERHEAPNRDERGQ